MALSYKTTKKEVKKTVAKPSNYLSGSLKSGDKYKAWDNSKGYVKPDLGKDKGSGIPYRELSKSHAKQYETIRTPIKPKTPVKKTSTKDLMYRAKRGDNLSKIAARYGMTGSELYKYQLKSGVRSKSAQKAFRTRGPDLIYKNTGIKIPASKLAAIQRRLK